MLVAYHNQSQPKINELKKKIEIYSFFMSQKIGKGYSSTVYRGENDITKQTVAIKVIELRSLKDNITRSLLDTQIICIRTISHPNILKFLNSYTTVNNCYIITEFCEGGDLAQQLRKKRKFTQDELMNFFYEFYGGYKCFSEAGYIHRDIKPANIFLKNGSIRIADFGFVKRSNQNPKECYNVGTPLYMAPQAMYHNIYSQKTDIWAMGIMLFQLANGKTPWKGINQAEIKKQIDKASIDFPVTCQLSENAKDFIKQCLIKNPFERISLKDMINHPWMKTIYAKFESSNHIPLLNLSLNQQKTKRSQSERSTMQGERKQKQDINILKKVNDDQVIIKKPKNPRTILDNLVSVLNYVRYLYKVHACLKPVDLPILQAAKIAIAQQLTLQMHLQQQMIKTKVNQFKLLDWQSFVNSPKWQVYKGVIEQYSSKYSNLIQSGKLKYSVKDKLQVNIKIPFSISLKDTIKDLYIDLQVDNKQNQFEHRKLQILDYLITLFHFNGIISQQGWQRFIQKSKINKIVERRCVVALDNYETTRREVEKKLVSLKLI